MDHLQITNNKGGSGLIGVPAFADPGGQMLGPAHRCQAPMGVAQKNFRLSGNEYLKQGPVTYICCHRIALTENAQCQFPRRNRDP